MRPVVVALVSVVVFVLGCVSRNPQVPMGIQPDYAAVNLARIVFLPPFVHPDPSRKAMVDMASVSGDGVLRVVESTVLSAFRDEPGVNGLSPTAFRKLAEGRPELQTLLENKLKAFAQSKEGSEPSPKPACRERSTYLEFYARCVATDPAWQTALADVATNAYNADAFLFVAVTELAKEHNDDKYGISSGVTVLLVDANGGRLIWGREQRDSLQSDASQRTFPEWGALYARLFSEPFWLDFPGRKFKKATTDR